MARIVVDVMLKPEILDPQGKAISHELPRIGVEELLSNPVIEDVVNVSVLED